MPSLMIDALTPGRSGAEEGTSLRHLSRDLLEQVLEVSSECVMCLDREWRFTYLNRAARALVGRNDLVGLGLWTEYPLNHAEPFLSRYRAAMEDGSAAEFEAYAPSVRRWMKIRAQPFDGGIILFSTDITDRKRAEEVRDANARQLSQVLEATSDAIVSLDRNWNYTFLNRQAELLLQRDDLLGKNVWREFPSTDADGILRRTMEEGTACELEVFNPAPLNSWFRVQTRPSPEGIVVFFRDVTEERKAREALLDQQATLGFVQEAARIATWVVDLRTEEIQFGAGSYPVYGLPLSNIRRLDDIRRMVVAEDLAEVKETGELALTSQDVTTVDYRITTPEGRTIWLERRCIRVCDEGGHVTHLRGMTTDITSRKRNEERLRVSEERYRVLSDLNPQALWSAAPDGEIVYANQGYLDYIGKTSADLGGLDWLTAFDPENRERVAASWAHSVRTGKEYAIEARLIRARDGAPRWWSLRALPVRGPEGNIQQWLGVSHEIHDARLAAEELKRRQEETERQRAELETVYRTAPIGLALFDPVEFRYLRLNDRQAEIVGLPPERILGRTLTEIAPIAGLREMFEQVAQGHPVREKLLEGELPMRPGEHRHWTVNYYPVYGSDGAIQAITAASLEITHQKKAELALIQSEKLAAVGRLASSISHEINNPLEAITNLLYLVATDERLPEETKVYVHLAQSETSRVSQIATQTLRFHRQAMKPTLLTAGELVGSVLGLYQGRLGNSNIQVEVGYASKTPFLCFENDIRQVLNNLIANSIDAMRNGGRLVVRAHDATDWTDTDAGFRRGVRITVADTGHGMPAAVKARIFEPFYTTKDLNGTGLGLWISHGIVQHHKGKLTARSSQAPGHTGTVFTLFLPLGEKTT